jgi:UDP-N-acetylmuramoylalanine--D-glutamate ligase
VGHQVLGLGIAGWSAARLLRAQGKEVWVWDEQDSELLRQRQAELEREGIPVHLGQPFQLLPGVKVVHTPMRGGPPGVLLMRRLLASNW